MSQIILNAIINNSIQLLISIPAILFIYNKYIKQTPIRIALLELYKELENHIEKNKKTNNYSDPFQEIQQMAADGDIIVQGREEDPTFFTSRNILENIPKRYWQDYTITPENHEENYEENIKIITKYNKSDQNKNTKKIYADLHVKIDKNTKTVLKKRILKK